MSTIDSLSKSVSDMDDDELFNFIREIRSRRRKKPEKPVRNSCKKKEVTLDSIIAAMSPEQLEQIMSKLGELE